MEESDISSEGSVDEVVDIEDEALEFESAADPVQVEASWTMWRDVTDSQHKVYLDDIDQLFLETARLEAPIIMSVVLYGKNSVKFTRKKVGKSL